MKVVELPVIVETIVQQLVRSPFTATATTPSTKVSQVMQRLQEEASAVASEDETPIKKESFLPEFKQMMDFQQKSSEREHEHSHSHVCED